MFCFSSQCLFVSTETTVRWSACFASQISTTRQLQPNNNYSFIPVNSRPYLLHTASAASAAFASIDKVRRHEFIARGPRERYSGTVTAAHEQGWQDQLEVNRQVIFFACTKNNLLAVFERTGTSTTANRRAGYKKKTLLAQARPSATYVFPPLISPFGVGKKVNSRIYRTVHDVTIVASTIVCMKQPELHGRAFVRTSVQEAVELYQTNATR